jgi:hypothetical protein
MLSQTRPARRLTSSGPTPIWTRARGRDASITTSACSITSRSWRRPPPVVMSSSSWMSSSACRALKNSGVALAPSGREVDSTLTTLAPALRRIRATNGPAHREERSTTVTSSSGRGPDGWDSHATVLRSGTGALGGIASSTAAGMSKRRARSTASLAPWCSTHSVRVAQCSEVTGPSTRAGSTSWSHGRATLKATHWSEARRIRHAPLAETRPLGHIPRSRLRRVNSSGQSMATAWPWAADRRSIRAATASSTRAWPPVNLGRWGEVGAFARRAMGVRR